MLDQWLFSTVHNCICKVIEEQTMWGQTVCRVWLPNQDAVVRVSRAALQPLWAELRPVIEAYRIAYVAAAAKVAEVLEGGTTTEHGPILLAPMESNVIPLPHQLHALSRAISGDRVRYLLADEVGLGKTVEAGLVMRELKLRGLVRRTLVVAPKGLATQWVAEMQSHFNERFQLVLGEDIGAIKRLVGDGSAVSPWTMFDQVIVSLDSVKPLDRRRGWSASRIAEYNRSRFEDLITAGWDLVVVDEAHRLGGSSDAVARYKLGRGLAEAAPYSLLLSATPHQGKSDPFHRLINLLDSDAFPDLESVTRERVAPFVIRTEKRKAIDAEGNPLFKPRRTQMAPVAWETRHHPQQRLYEAVTDYVRDGYNRALREKKRHIGFLMILMQRLVTSSTRAILTTLERREAVLKGNELRDWQLSLRLDAASGADAEIQELYDMDGQELLDDLLSRVSAHQFERSHVGTLLDATRACEQAGPDAKAEALIDWLYRLQAEENEPDLKALIFTEFVPTQEMLREFLDARGISVVTLNGSMDMDARKRAQDAFRHEARVLISTDAGGEGLNLQFCHVIVNYDIPWNPMRLEQRIGRVDRIGQRRPVRAINFAIEDSVEYRVREVLEQKLAVIFEEFGIDKTGDVLDSADAGELFEETFAAAILDPESIERTTDETATRIRNEIRKAREASSPLGPSAEPDMQSAERLRLHPLPNWLERMTVRYLGAHGGKAEKRRDAWDLTWPDGERLSRCVFSAQDAERMPDADLLTLENNRIRGLALSLPLVAAGQPIPMVSMGDLPPNVGGAFGLFEIRVQSGLWGGGRFIRTPLVRRRHLGVFVDAQDRVFLPTARHIWDSIQSAELLIEDALSGEQSQALHDRLMDAARQAGEAVFSALRQEHQHAIEREEERGATALRARRRAIERLGLPEVRQHRLKRCDADEAEWLREIEGARQIMPEIRPLLLMQIAGKGAT
ncbi:DEAD/DEAH box helicase [Hoeflea sp.]|uniref:DEAD/DEAH box helicase n=1 Tax=Hoeflea sp. TaxID=1940281 RepID=UPI003B022059